MSTASDNHDDGAQLDRATARARLVVDRVACGEISARDLPGNDLELVRKYLETFWEIAKGSLDDLQAEIAVLGLTDPTAVNRSRRAAARYLEELIALMQISSTATIRNLERARRRMMKPHDNDHANN